MEFTYPANLTFLRAIGANRQAVLSSILAHPRYEKGPGRARVDTLSAHPVSLYTSFHAGHPPTSSSTVPELSLLSPTHCVMLYVRPPLEITVQWRTPGRRKTTPEKPSSPCRPQRTGTGAVRENKPRESQRAPLPNTAGCCRYRAVYTAVERHYRAAPGTELCCAVLQSRAM